MTIATTLSPLKGDFYGFESDLTDSQQDVIHRLRTYLDAEIRPHLPRLWEKAEFPTGLPKALASLGLLGTGFEGLSDVQDSGVFRGFVTLELARVDASLSTFLGVHRGLAMGSIDILGSEEQKAAWLPGMAAGDHVGAFGLTEPHSGSDAARGLQTVARRDGDHWVLTGEKRWIGNATWGQIVIIWARDEQDGRVKGFIVPTDTPGYTATKIEGKMSHRPVQNADIVLDNVRIPHSLKLAHANSFADTTRILRQTRLDVAWAAVGNAMGAYEAALHYTLEREQFGRPIAANQMVQQHLVTALSNITAGLAMTIRATEMLEKGIESDEFSAMAKLFTTSTARETVARSREVMGGNGITLEHDVIRYFLDAEALYSFEGTREMNTLIIGRSITGHSAFN